MMPGVQRRNLRLGVQRRVMIVVGLAALLAHAGVEAVERAALARAAPEQLAP